MKKPLLFMAVFVAMVISILPCAMADDHYAAQNGQAEAGSYTSWDKAASNIQDAVNSANTNDTVWVGAGRYTLPTNAVVYTGTNVVYINKPLTLRSSNSVPAAVIIDGGGANRGIAVYYAVTTTNRFVIDGFTISNCYATNSGGGIRFYAKTCEWTGMVQNCVISDNIAGKQTGIKSQGGGIFFDSDYYWNNYGLIVSNCVVRNNRAIHGGAAGATEFGYGGGIYFSSFGVLQITGCLIVSNTATLGGGLYCINARSIIENCFFLANMSVTSGAGNVMNTVKGGGVALYQAGPHVFRNDLFYGNSSYGSGGAIFGQVNAADILNCTIVSNVILGVSYYYSAGIGLGPPYGEQITANICNSIIYSNTIDGVSRDIFFSVYAGDYCKGGTNLYFTNCCLTSTNTVATLETFKTNVFGSGNFTNNPAFQDWAGQDFRLKPISPCINTGLDQNWMINAVDLNGRKRLRYGRVDVGACEAIYGGAIYMLR